MGQGTYEGRSLNLCWFLRKNTQLPSRSREDEGADGFSCRLPPVFPQKWNEDQKDRELPILPSLCLASPLSHDEEGMNR